MYSFIVLGQIPGTNIRISFAAWLLLCLLGLAIYAWVKLYRRDDAISLTPTITADEQTATAH